MTGHFPILSLLLWLPVLGGCLVLLAGRIAPQTVRWLSLFVSVLVFAVSAVGLGLNQLILALCVEEIGFNLFFSKVAATGCVFFWNYFARRVLVFGGTHA